MLVYELNDLNLKITSRSATSSIEKVLPKTLPKESEVNAKQKSERGATHGCAIRGGGGQGQCTIESQSFSKFFKNSKTFTGFFSIEA